MCLLDLGGTTYQNVRTCDTAVCLCHRKGSTRCRSLRVSLSPLLTGAGGGGGGGGGKGAGGGGVVDIMC